MKSQLTNSFLGPLLDRSGFTLMEVLVAVTLISTASALVTVSVFQILSFQRTWRDEVIATRDLRHASSLFAGDALKTATSTLVDGASATTTVSLYWTDVSEVTHTATYATSSGDVLQRQLDGSVFEVAKKVVSVGFRRSGNTIIFDLAVTAGDGATVSSTLTTFLRYAQ